MDGGRTVRLSLHPAQIDYLRASLADFISGLNGDIATLPEDPAVEAWKAERDVYRRLDEGLANDLVVAVDEETLRLGRRWAAANDRSEEFHRIVFEHQTLQGFSEQLEAEL
jgi:hypothetical protein